MTSPKRVPALADLNRMSTLRQLSYQINRIPNRIADPLQLIMGTVTAATDVHTYTVQCSDDGVDRVMPSVAPYAPQVGDGVWVARLGPTYLLLELRAGPIDQDGRAAVVFSAQASNSVTVTYPVPYVAAPRVRHSVEVGSNLDILSNATTITANQASFRLFNRALSAVSGTAFLVWEAKGS